MFLRKFYDLGEDSGGGGIDNPFAGAQAGDVTAVEGGDGDAFPKEVMPDDDEDDFDENAAIEAEKVEEPEEKPEEPEKEETPEEEPAEEVKPEISFQEELKKADKWEVMKDLGFDEFAIGLLKYKEETGDVTPYLEVKTVDYASFSDEEIMRHDLRKQYKGMSEPAFNRLFDKKVTEQFQLDEEVHGIEDAELGRELLKFEADKIRAKAIEEQQQFKAPEKPADDTAQRQQQAALEQEAKIKEYKGYVNDSKVTQSLRADKRLVFGSGKDAYKFAVEKPDDLVDTAINPNLLFNDLVDKNGNADLNKVYKAKAYIANMDKVEQMLINHGKTLGEKKTFEELENPSAKQPDSGVPDLDLTPAQALARGGKVTGG